MRLPALLSSVSGLLAELCYRLRTGPVRTANWLADRFRDAGLDRQFGIISSPRRSLKQLGFDSPYFVAYQPFSFSDLYETLNTMKFTPEDVLLDLGSGMGRVVCAAAAIHPFRAVIGVEISPELCEIARANLQRIAPKLLCSSIEIVNCNAIDYEIPLEVNIIYLFNPFSGPVLGQVFQNISASLRKHPRPITIAFYGTVSSKHFTTQAAKHTWLRLSSRHVLNTGATLLTYVNYAENSLDKPDS